MKNICFVSLNANSPWGGSEDLWSQAALLLLSKGYNVSVIFYDWGNNKSEELIKLIASGIQLVTIPKHQTIRSKFRKNLNRFLGDIFQKQITTAYKKIKPDLVIHTNMAPRGADILKWVITNKIPYILDIQLADDYLWHCYDEAMLQCYLNANTVCFLCEKNKITTEKQLGVKLTNTKKHFNPIKVKGPANTILDKKITTVNFACVGRMGIEHKRQDLILEILSQDKWLNRSWTLNFYGKGEHEVSLRRLVDMYELNSRVSFKGYVNDIEELWNENHVLLLPSTYEGMSLSVIEAMKSGRIVVTTNVASSIEYIQDGINGFKSPGPTFEEFDLAMEKAWNEQANWHSIALSAQKTINDKFPNNAAEYFVTNILAL